MSITEYGSLRIDLAGGTIDIPPIGLYLHGAVTLNIAISLKSHVHLEKIDSNEIKIISKDYNSTRTITPSEMNPENVMSDYFKELKFVVQILDYFAIKEGIAITLSSDSPAGAGLGGSSAMGMAIFQAVSKLNKKEYPPQTVIRVIRSIEERILNAGPVGYQDYYPSIYGGILALTPTLEQIKVRQLHTKERAEQIKDRIILVDSKSTRISGVNNWEVYKNFFDNDTHTRSGLAKIARISNDAVIALEKNNYDDLCDLIAEEGSVRSSLFPNIVSSEIKNVYTRLQDSYQDIGLKVCGAGGGGYFLLTDKEGRYDDICQSIRDLGMTPISFAVEEAHT